MEEDPVFNVGERVEMINNLNKGQIGIVRYFGEIDGKKGNWCGVELEEAKGNHSGAIEGKQYFTCREGSGIFVRGKHLKLIESKNSQGETIKEETTKTIEEQSKTSSNTSIKEPANVKEDTKESTKEVKEPGKFKVGAQSGDSKTKTMGLLNKSSAASKLPGTGLGTSKSSTANPAEKIKVSSKVVDKSDKQEKQDALEKQVQQFEEEMQAKELEIAQLREEIEKKDDVMNDMSSSLEESQNKLDAKDQRISELLEQVKILEEDLAKEEQKNTSLTKDLQLNKEQFANLEEETEILHAALKEAEESTAIIEALTMQKESIEGKLETLKKQFDEKVTENQQLLQEKELAQLELDEAMKGDNEDSNQDNNGDGNSNNNQGNGNNSELVKSNVRLRQAVQVLNDQLELEKIESLEKIIELEEKILKLPVLEETIKKLNADLISGSNQMKLKLEEIEELKETLEIHSESVEMVEKLTEKIESFEEQNMQLKMQLKELKEIKKVNEELIQSYEENNKEMEQEIQNYEFTTYELKRLLQEKEDQLADGEKTIERMKQKAIQYKQQSASYQEEALAASNSIDQKISSAESVQGNIQKLIDTQQELFTSKRYIFKKYLTSALDCIDSSVQSASRTDLIVASIPESLFVFSISGESVRSLESLGKSKLKCELLHKELLEYIERETDQMIRQENSSLFEWLVQLLDNTCSLQYYINEQLQLYYAANTMGELQELCKSQGSQVISQGSFFVEQVLRSLMEDNISPKVSLEPIVTANAKLSVVFSVQQASEQTESLSSYKSNPGNVVQHSSAQMKKVITSLRVSVLGRMFFCKYYSSKDADLLFKTLDKRIAEFVAYLDSPVVLNSLKLQKLYEYCQVIEEMIKEITNQECEMFIGIQKTELKDDMEEQQQQQANAGQDSETLKQRISKFRKAISDIANLLNSLNSDADQKIQHGQGQQQEQNTFLRYPGSIWCQAISSIKTQLEDTATTAENEKKLQEELTAQMIKQVQLEKSIEDLTKIRHTLEQRVVSLQLQSERVALLEGEKKRFQEKEKSFKEATEIIQQELDNTKKKLRESQEELKTLKQLTQPGSNLLQSTGISRNQSLRNSVGPQFMKGSLSSKVNEQNIMNTSGVFLGLGGMGDQEENNTDLLSVYERENNCLRSLHLKERIVGLTEQSQNLALFKQLKQKDPSKSTLTFLAKQVSQATAIHAQGLSVLASKTVVDLEQISKKSLSEKDQNIKEYLEKENSQIDALRYQAFKICNEISKKVSKDQSSYKQRIEIAQDSSTAGDRQLLKLGAITFNSQSAEPETITRLTVSVDDWTKIRQVF